MYFTAITSLSQLKKEYRMLAIANHPDKGGSEEKMKAINAEFEKLYAVWKDRKDNGEYANDYDGASAQQYQSYVYNEYRWYGSRVSLYKGLKDMNRLVREWLKETYPHCKFSVEGEWYSGGCSVTVTLVEADFQPFVKETERNVYGYDINHYHIDKHETLTDRCKEVMSNVIDYVMSYNYDESDPMVDYFHTNFYASFRIGKSDNKFEYKPYTLKAKAGDTYKHKVGKLHAAINKLMGKYQWREYREWNCKTREYEPTSIQVLSYPFYERWERLTYSQPSILKRKIEQFKALGILTEPYRSSIRYIGMTPETIATLAAEDEEDKRLEAEFYAKKANKNIAKPTVKPATQPTAIPADIQIIDYSDRAIAVIGNTKSIKDDLKALGGRFNPKLTCGAGWIFSKSKLTELEELLKK